MKYTNGNDIVVGEPVWLNDGVNIGRVSVVLEIQGLWEKWGLDEPGVFVCFDFSGKTATEDAFTPKKDIEREGLERMTLTEELEIKDIYTRFCSIKPEAVGLSYTVLLHKAYRGMKWILVLFRGTSGNKQFYVSREDSTEFMEISEKEVFD